MIEYPCVPIHPGIDQSPSEKSRFLKWKLKTVGKLSQDEADWLQSHENLTKVKNTTSNSQ